jgi:hypothetical protein
MKAAVYSKYGPPDVLQIKDVEKPVPKDNEVLIKVRSASVNPLDGGLMKGGGRVVTGLRKPKVARLGVDVAGQVEAVGQIAWNGIKALLESVTLYIGRALALQRVDWLVPLRRNSREQANDRQYTRCRETFLLRYALFTDYWRKQAIPLRRSRLNSDCLPFLELAALRQLIGHCG